MVAVSWVCPCVIGYPGVGVTPLPARLCMQTIGRRDFVAVSVYILAQT